MIFNVDSDKKDKIGIYLIKNIINNNLYIGQTGDRFIERYWNHKWKLNKQQHDNKHLQKAWNKYGENAFVFEIIVVVEDIRLLNDLEKKYIIEYSQKYNLYNIQTGGQNGGMKNVPMSEETKRKIGLKNKINMTGRKVSEKTKEKMSKQRKGKTNWKNCKLREDEAILIKKKLMEGIRPILVSEQLNVDYKIVNNIYSSNTYKSAYVEGWEDFYKSRPKNLNQIGRRYHTKITESDKERIKSMRKQGYTQNQIANSIGVSRSTICKYL